jgi:hypothetical protein
MAKSWHRFVPGQAYDRDEIVTICEMHIRNDRLSNPDEAELSLDEIRRCPYQRLVWAPYAGWGRSQTNPSAWRTAQGEEIWKRHVIRKIVKGQPANPQPHAHSLPAAHLRRVKSTTPLEGRTIMYGDIAVPVLERNWQGGSEPYRYVTHLKPGEKWHDAKVTPNKLPTERYVQLSEGSIPPGAIAAQELLTEGASLAVWTDTWHGAVFMSPDLICVELTGELWDILQKIKTATHNRWFASSCEK